METSIIISGYGGQGILFAGSLLCHAAVIEGKNTTWIPSYGAEMRGGAANCSVNISDDEISSPVIDRADVLFALNLPSELKFEHRIKPGGLMLLNTSLVKKIPERHDIEYLNMNLNDMAENLEGEGFANVIAVGAFVEKTKILSVESLKQALTEMVPEKRRHLLPANIASLECGVNFIKNSTKVSL